MAFDMHKLLWFLENPTTAPLVMAAVGACFGSFISLISYRLPRDLPVVATHSRCPKCSMILKWKDLFPVFSFLLNRGRCRGCHAHVSWRYPLIECLTAAGFVCIFYLAGVQWQLLTLLGLFVCLMAMIVTDFEHYIIPDELQLAIGALGVVHLLLMDMPLSQGFVGLLIGGGAGLALRYGFLYLRNKDALGMGDVKFLAVSGIWLGWQPLVPYLFYAGILGILTAGLWRALGRGVRYPFGPSLAASLWLLVLYPSCGHNFWRLHESLTIWLMR